MKHLEAKRSVMRASPLTEVGGQTEWMSLHLDPVLVKVET